MKKSIGLVIGLLRVSGDTQDVLRQRQAIERQAKADGIRIDLWIEDKLSRDLPEQRVEFQRLIRMVEQGEVRRVYIEEFERFGIPGGRGWMHYAYIFERAGCELLAVKEGNLLEASIGSEVQNFFKGEASRERQEKTSYAIQSSKVSLAEDGNALGGIPPYGFDKACYSAAGELQWTLFYRTRSHRILTTYANGQAIKTEERIGQSAAPRKAKAEILRWVPSSDSHRLEVVRQLFQSFTTEVVSTMTLAQRLNAQGEQIYGHAWNLRNIEYILHNPIYKGTWTYFRSSVGRFHETRGKRIIEVDKKLQHRLRYEKGKGKKRRIQRFRLAEDWTVKEGAVEQVVSVPLWEETERRLQARDKRNHPPRNADTWLSGLLYCGGCGEKMYAYAQKAGVYGYHCQTYTRQYRATGNQAKCTCGHNVILHSEAEQMVMDKMRQMGVILEANKQDPEGALSKAYLDLATGLGVDALPYQERREAFSQTDGIIAKIGQEAGLPAERIAPRPDGKPTFHGGFTVTLERAGRLLDFLQRTYPGLTPAEILRELRIDPAEAIDEQRASNADHLAEVRARYDKWVEAKVEAEDKEEKETIARKLKELKAEMDRINAASQPSATVLDLIERLQRAVATVNNSAASGKLQLADAVRQFFSRVVLHFRKVPWGMRFRYKVVEEETDFVLSTEIDSTIRHTGKFRTLLAGILAG